MVLSRQKLGSGFQTWHQTRSSALSDLLNQKLRSWNAVQKSVFYGRSWHSLKFVNHWARERSWGGWSRKVGYMVENESYEHQVGNRQVSPCFPHLLRALPSLCPQRFLWLDSVISCPSFTSSQCLLFKILAIVRGYLVCPLS